MARNNNLFGYAPLEFYNSLRKNEILSSLLYTVEKIPLCGLKKGFVLVCTFAKEIEKPPTCRKLELHEQS